MTVRPPSTDYVDPLDPGRPQPFLRRLSWAFVMDTGGQIVSLLLSFVLAGLLGPRTYGVAAMAMVYVMFIQLVQRQGMAAALIQRERLERAHLDTAFWLILLLSVATMGASIAGAGWWAGLNDVPELEPVTVALSVLLLVEALSTVQRALLTRAMAFRALAIRTMAGLLVGGVIGLLGALDGWGVWALVAQQITTAGTNLIVLWAASSWRPGRSVSRAAARDLWGFSVGAFVSSLASFISNRSDALLIGLFFGPVVVGIYRLGSRLVDAVTAALLRPVQSMALAELSPVQSDPIVFADRLARLSRVTAVSTMPALGILAGCSSALLAVLGDEWSGAVIVTQLLCVAGVAKVLVTLDGPVLQAQGRPMFQAGVSWAVAAVSAASFAVIGLTVHTSSSESDAAVVAGARAFIYGVVVVAIHLIIIRRYTRMSAASIARTYGAPFVACVCAAVAGDVVARMLAAGDIAVLLASAASSGAVGAGLILILCEDVRSLAVKLIVRSRSDLSGAGAK